MSSLDGEGKPDTLEVCISVLCALTTIYRQPEIADLPETPSLSALCPRVSAFRYSRVSPSPEPARPAAPWPAEFI